MNFTRLLIQQEKHDEESRQFVVSQLTAPFSSLYLLLSNDLTPRSIIIFLLLLGSDSAPPQESLNFHLVWMNAGRPSSRHRSQLIEHTFGSFSPSLCLNRSVTFICRREASKSTWLKVLRSVLRDDTIMIYLGRLQRSRSVLLIIRSHTRAGGCRGC